MYFTTRNKKWSAWTLLLKNKLRCLFLCFASFFFSSVAVEIGLFERTTWVCVRLAPGARSTVKRLLEKHNKSELPFRASYFAFPAPKADGSDTFEGQDRLRRTVRPSAVVGVAVLVAIL